MAAMLVALKRSGRRDLLGLLAARRITLSDLFEAYERRGDALEQLAARADSPLLGELVDAWLAWARSSAGVSIRTRRRLTPQTVRRYAVSWEGFFAVLPRGRDARLSELTPGFVADYRVARVRATGGRTRKPDPARPLSGATLNRDLAALAAFLRWCREVRRLAVPALRVQREREPQGRTRWLSSDELAAFEAACPGDWWALFATLFYTGMRVGEALGLRGADVLLHARRIVLAEDGRRLKAAASVRDLPIPEPLERALAPFLARLAPGPADPVFPVHYPDVRRAWRAVCARAGIAGATIHDARHTFAVHAMQAGVPLVRLQRLLGHATAQMTLRYAQHAPAAYLDADARAIAQHMGGATDQEREARAAAARRELRQA
jgi:integrase